MKYSIEAVEGEEKTDNYYEQLCLRVFNIYMWLMDAVWAVQNDRVIT